MLDSQTPTADAFRQISLRERIINELFPGRILVQSFSVVLWDTFDVIRGQSQPTCQVTQCH